jgi:hypothetical protein
VEKEKGSLTDPAVAFNRLLDKLLRVSPRDIRKALQRPGVDTHAEALSKADLNPRAAIRISDPAQIPSIENFSLLPCPAIRILRGEAATTPIFA